MRLRSRAGIAEGDLIEAIFKRGKIILSRKVAIDRSQFPNADDEYTPAQRRIIDARLVKADLDIKAGPVSRTFETAEEFIADLHKARTKLSTKKPSYLANENSPYLHFERSYNKAPEEISARFR